MLSEHLHELLVNLVVQLLESVADINVSHFRQHHHKVICDLTLNLFDLSDDLSVVVL